MVQRLQMRTRTEQLDRDPQAAHQGGRPRAWYGPLQTEPTIHNSEQRVRAYLGGRTLARRYALNRRHEGVRAQSASILGRTRASSEIRPEPQTQGSTCTECKHSREGER